MDFLYGFSRILPVSLNQLFFLVLFLLTSGLLFLSMLKIILIFWQITGFCVSPIFPECISLKFERFFERKVMKKKKSSVESDKFVLRFFSLIKRS